MIYRLVVLAQQGYFGKCFWEMGVCGLGCCLNRGLRRFSLMGCDAPPVCPDRCGCRGLGVMVDV